MEGSALYRRGNGPIYDEFKERDHVDLWSWNVNGINATMSKGIFQKFMQDYNPTVLCLNETKTTQDVIEKKSLHGNIPPGYSQYWNCSTSRAGYSGTAIFTKVKPLEVNFNFGKKHVDEGRSITMEFNNFILVSTYVPNAGEGLKRLDYRIDEWDVDFH